MNPPDKLSKPVEDRSATKSKEVPGISETSGFATAYVGADSLNRHGNIDSAEVAGNAGMDGIVKSYASNTPESLAGFMAEQEYVRSFNIHAAEKGFSPLEASATRLGSHDSNSPDILTSWGDTYQPKFYATPGGTADALTEIVAGTNGPINRYAGQQLLAPADQIEQVRSIVQGKVDAALVAGDEQQASLLSDSLSRLTDRITSPDGISSDAITHHQMQSYAAIAKDGGVTSLGDGINIFDSGVLLGESAALAAGLSGAISIGGLLLSASGDLLNGKITSTEMSARIAEWWKAAGKSTVLEAGMRSAVSGGLASLDSLDPTGAVVIATLALDLAKLGARASSGELQEGEIEQTFKRIALYKLPVIGASAVAVSVVGVPVGVAIVVAGHLIVRELIRRHDVQQSCIGFLGDMQKEMEKSVQMLGGQVAATERSLALAGIRAESIARSLASAEETRTSAVSRLYAAKEISREGNWTEMAELLRQLDGRQKR